MKAVTEVETRTIPAAEFKAKCLDLMNQVRAGKLHLVVTKRGVPYMHAVPPTAKPQVFRSVVGRIAGGKVLGDIVSPLPEEWTLPEEVQMPKGKAKEKGKKR